MNIAAIYRKLIFFFSKRLILHELHELEYKLWRSNVYGSKSLLCDVMQELDYINQVFCDERLSPEALYTFWGHTECLKEDYERMAHGHGRADIL